MPKFKPFCSIETKMGIPHPGFLCKAGNTSVVSVLEVKAMKNVSLAPGDACTISWLYRGIFIFPSAELGSLSSLSFHPERPHSPRISLLLFNFVWVYGHSSSYIPALTCRVAGKATFSMRSHESYRPFSQKYTLTY